MTETSPPTSTRHLYEKIQIVTHCATNCPGLIIRIFLRIVEQRKEEYYKVLEECSRGWHDGENDIMPWWNFFLSVLRSAYGELAHKVEDKMSAGPKSDLVRRVINDQVGPFVLSEIAAQAPGVSLSLIKKILMTMKKEGAVNNSGRGRGAVWEVIRKS